MLTLANGKQGALFKLLLSAGYSFCCRPFCSPIQASLFISAFQLLWMPTLFGTWGPGAADVPAALAKTYMPQCPVFLQYRPDLPRSHIYRIFIKANVPNGKCMLFLHVLQRRPKVCLLSQLPHLRCQLYKHFHTCRPRKLGPLCLYPATIRPEMRNVHPLLLLLALVFRDCVVKHTVLESNCL